MRVAGFTWRASAHVLCDPDRENVTHTLPAPDDRLYGTKMRSSKEAGQAYSQINQKRLINFIRAISVQPLDRNRQHPDTVKPKSQIKNLKKDREENIDCRRAQNRDTLYHPSYASLTSLTLNAQPIFSDGIQRRSSK